MSNHHPPNHPYQPPYLQPFGQGGAGPQPGQVHGPMMGGPAYGYQSQAFHSGVPQGVYPVRPAAPFFNFSNDRFLKGLLIGAAATYLVTNEGVQRAVIKGVVRTWSMLQGGIEEIKERFEDAEAELHHDAERRATQKDD